MTKYVNGLQSIECEIQEGLDLYLKIFILLYADDTVLLAESAENLQNQLTAFGEYCDTWKMKVNVDKTKIMVFGMGKVNPNVRFLYQNIELEIVKDFNYLGVIFTKTCNFD